MTVVLFLVQEGPIHATCVMHMLGRGSDVLCLEIWEIRVCACVEVMDACCCAVVVLCTRVPLDDALQNITSACAVTCWTSVMEVSGYAETPFISVCCMALS